MVENFAWLAIIIVDFFSFLSIKLYAKAKDAKQSYTNKRCTLLREMNTNKNTELQMRQKHRSSDAKLSIQENKKH